MLYFLILVFGIFSRLVVHLPNFTPVIVLSLLSGVYLPRKYSLIFPFGLMLISDLLLGLHDTVAFTWGSVVLIASLGILIRKNRRMDILAGYSIVAAFIFFLITNFGAWLSLYPRTVDGLRLCYLAALPFFRMEILSSVLYTVMIVGLYGYVARQIKASQAAKLWLAN